MSVKELTVKLEGLELNERELASLEKDINAVVLKHIAATKQRGIIGSITGKPAITIGKLRPEWLGIWLKTFANKIDLEKQHFNPVQTIGMH